LKRTGTLLLAGLAFGGAAVAAPSAQAVTANAACTFGYSVASQWPGGFTAQLTIGYVLPAASSGWAVGFDFAAADQRVTASWNANVVQRANHVSATNSPFAPALMPQSGSLTVSFAGSFTTGNPAPVHVTFDGISCSSSSLNV
jgi:hypothetical protein